MLNDFTELIHQHVLNFISRSDLYYSCSAGANDHDAANVPIIFLHGVGLGVFPYLYFLRCLKAALPDTPIILIEVSHPD